MKKTVPEEDFEFIVNSVSGWEHFEGKTVLIAGANGFLPAYMLETLLYLNDKKPLNRVKVIGMVRDMERGRARFAVRQGRNDLLLIEHDVNKPVSLEGPVDYIIHAASQASPKYFGSDPVGTLAANVLGTHNLLTLAREKRSEGFLFFSSGEVYGRLAEGQIPTKEEWYGYIDPLEVRSCYGESKKMGETMCAAWQHQYGVPAKIVRPFHTYGPGMRLDDGRVFADFVADVVNGRDIVMKSDGSAKRAFCYLSDATAGYFTVLLKGNNGEAYNIGNDRAEATILELANIIVNLAPGGGLKVITAPAREDSSYLKSSISRTCPDISRARALGWEPRYDIKAGFERTLRSFLE